MGEVWAIMAEDAYDIMAENAYDHGANLVGVVVGTAEDVAGHLTGLARRRAEEVAGDFPVNIVRVAESDGSERVWVELILGAVSGRTWTARRFAVERLA